MNEILFLILAVTLVVFVAIDYVRFGMQIGAFINIAEELTIMYEYATEVLERGDLDFEFHGRRFHMFVKEGDYKSLVEQTRLAICEVQDEYSRIDSRYLMEMDEELTAEVETLYQDVQNIQNAIRITKWQNGWE